MLEEFAGRLQKVRESLEEDYHLPKFEEEIIQMRDDYMAKLRETLDRVDQRSSIWRKHSDKADREVEEQGLDVSENPGEGE